MQKTNGHKIMTQAINIENTGSLIANTPEKGSELEEESPERKNLR